MEIQPIIASQRVSLPRNGKHTSFCLNHCKKITVNNTHRYYDIADTLYDAIKLGLIDQSILLRNRQRQETHRIIDSLARHANYLNRLQAEHLCQ